MQPILSERFSSSSSSSYYQVLPSLEYLVTYLQQKLCATGDSGCQDEVAALQTAKSVDIDFDTISHAVIVRAHWDSPASRGGWTETATLRRGSGPLEVGILNNETPDEPEELKLGGFLTVVGSDNEPSAFLHVQQLLR